MRILLTGATGYIGQHMLRNLLEQGHHVTCCVRSPEHFKTPKGHNGQVDVVQVDFLEDGAAEKLNTKIDVAYYLIHSMSASMKDFDNMEQRAARNFLMLLAGSGCQQIIYLSGISNEKSLSKHLSSRFQVENELRTGETPVTVLRAGIIVGAGSASFELIRDLVEKLPAMITPKWLKTLCQPIAIENVLEFLMGVALKCEYYGCSFDIGGEQILSYKQMLEGYAKIRGLKRRIYVVPLMTPRLSSYWLYFVTSVSYPLAVNLVDSMKVEVVCKPNDLAEKLGIELISYPDAIREILKTYRSRSLVSSWKDALSSSYSGKRLQEFYEVPAHGCFHDDKKRKISDAPEEVIENIWSIGGERGWYYGNWLWRLRGFLDKLFGGVGLRRGRTHAQKIEAGDSLDFWRVLVADKEAGRLLLFAEMKLPGEAWLEFRLEPEGDNHILTQTATFRPKGISGRLYWYMISPLHAFVFNGMIRGITRYRSDKNERAKFL